MLVVMIVLISQPFQDQLLLMCKGTNRDDDKLYSNSNSII